MDYSHNYFGKSLSTLTWKDIENYFTEAKEETETIEFKSFVGKEVQDSQYKGIFAAACALLNSNGGIIIWGAPVGVKISGKKEKSFQGALSPLNVVLEKDALISKVSGQIIPMPEGISLQIIEKGNSCICIFEIQKSNYSPHQTDHTYYMRLDGQSVPAPHYFVEAMFRQVKYPHLEGFVRIHNIGFAGGLNHNYHLTLEVFICNWSPLQNETNVHFSLTNDLGFIAGFGFQSPHTLATEKYWDSGKSVKYSNLVEVLHYGSPATKMVTIEIPGNRIPGDINFTIYFGGKNSPQKASDYKCKITIQPGVNDPPKCEIIEKAENVSMHEMPGADTSKEEKLRILLGR